MSRPAAISPKATGADGPITRIVRENSLSPSSFRPRATILLGLAGSFLAHFIGRGIGWYSDGDPPGFIASVVGAIVLLGLYRVALGKRRA